MSRGAVLVLGILAIVGGIGLGMLAALASGSGAKTPTSSGLIGVKGVVNQITLKEKPTPADVKTRIEGALRRSAELEAKDIRVAVSGNEVTLVKQRELAEDGILVADDA